MPRKDKRWRWSGHAAGGFNEAGAVMPRKDDIGFRIVVA